MLEERALREPVAFVGIDGGGGAGKSTFAQAVAARRRDAAVAHLDDFRSTIGGPDSVDVGRFERDVLGPLRAGRAAHFRRFDWPSQQLGEWHEIRPCRVLVVEGVFALQPALRPLYDATVWVETRRDIRLSRGLERDGEDARAQWRDWMAGEDRYVREQEPQAWVDLVVS